MRYILVMLGILLALGLIGAEAMELIRVLAG